MSTKTLVSVDRVIYTQAISRNILGRVLAPKNILNNQNINRVSSYKI